MPEVKKGSQVPLQQNKRARPRFLASGSDLNHAAFVKSDAPPPIVTRRASQKIRWTHMKMIREFDDHRLAQLTFFPQQLRSQFPLPQEPPQVRSVHLVLLHEKSEVAHEVMIPAWRRYMSPFGKSSAVRDYNPSSCRPPHPISPAPP